MAETELNPACCSRNAVVTGEYTPKGTYTKIAGLDVYQTGDASSKRAVFFVYDAFGLASQTLQGADRLASSVNALVLIPDFFEGEPIGLDVFPIDSEEKKVRAQKFMAEKADSAKGASTALNVRKEAGEKFSGVESWGAFGLCWGGKVTALLSGEGTLFKAAGAAHPGLLVTEEAERMKIPYCCFFSKEDGTPEAVEAYTQALMSNGNDNVVENYSTMHHGWMGARANLQDKENEKEYKRGYDQTATFFKKHL